MNYGIRIKDRLKGWIVCLQVVDNQLNEWTRTSETFHFYSRRRLLRWRRWVWWEGRGGACVRLWAWLTLEHGARVLPFLIEQVVGNCGQLTVGVEAMEVGGATGGEGVAKGEMGGAFGEKQPMDQVVD